MSDEDKIRQLIMTWTRAVHTGDLPTVLAQHTDDIVMFDVPPPERGVLGSGLRGDVAAVLRVAGVRVDVRAR